MGAKREAPRPDDGRGTPGRRSTKPGCDGRTPRCRRSKVDPASDAFQTLFEAHHRWVTEHWNGRTPDRNAYTGLAQLYVTDSRFAAAYGGQANAEVIRAVIQT
ncbi:hypothetical protein C5E11_13250 [Clavibacter michiganensis]|nr:hypothetical protein C5E11_13250 [Clavibacter michiganensis]